MNKTKIFFVFLITIITLGLCFNKIQVFSQSQTNLVINLPVNTIKIGDQITISVEVENTIDLYGFDLTVNYDPQLLNLAEDSYQLGTFLNNNPLTIGPNIDEQAGKFQISMMNTGLTSGSSGSGVLFTLPFEAMANGTALFWLDPASLIDSEGNPINFQAEISSLTIGSVTVTPTPTTIDTPEETEEKASFLLAPSSANYYLGDQPEIEIRLDTWSNPVSGADLILNFDPLNWEVAEITEGTIFASYPLKEFDNSSGQVKISGTAEYNNYYSGRGNFATLKFNLKSAGITSLKFDYSPGSTLDCNIVSALTGQELLTEEPLSGQYEMINNPLLNFEYNLPHRLPSVGNQATVNLSTVDQSFTKQIEVDSSGIYQGLSLAELVINQNYEFIIKVAGYLRKKGNEIITLYGGDNPKEGYLDFGDLIGGDLNDDQIINNIDLAALFKAWSSAGDGDFNGDGLVNNFDVWVMFANFFQEAQLGY